MEYGFRRTLEADLPRARRLVEEALKEQGFGILTDIDVQATLKTKLGVDFDRYVILGACNPVLAERALRAERELGLLLPCNVILYQDDSAEADTGRTVVSAFDPGVGMALVGNPELDAIGAEAKVKLEAALDAAFDAAGGPSASANQTTGAGAR